MSDAQQYIIENEPFYQTTANEVALYEAAYARRLPVMVKGPTGCGKSRFIEYMAWKLQKPLITVACNEDMTAADLVGRFLLDENGTRWQDGPLTVAARIGAICYLDEVVEARKDTTVVLHPLSDDRRILPIERTGEVLKAPPEFMLIVSYNPGYQNLLKGMKPSTRQRFIAMRFDYPDMETETKIIQQETDIDHATSTQLIELAHALRVLKDHDLEESASTRLLVYAATLIKSGCDPIEACRAAIIEPLTDEEETVNALMEVVKAKMVID